jgi:hypothetical protein
LLDVESDFQAPAHKSLHRRTHRLRALFRRPYQASYGFQLDMP